MMLASLLSSSKDVGPESRLQASQILGETRWLDDLLRAYDGLASPHKDGRYATESIRLDLLAADVVTPIGMSCSTHISLDACEIYAQVDRLAFWRALRNVVCNALQAAGPAGTVAVRISSVDGFAVVDVDDDGPGFDATKPTATSLGLAIVEEFVSSCGGDLEIRRGSLGGCRARLRLPAADGYASDPFGAQCAS